MKSKRTLIILAIVVVIGLFGMTYAFFEYYGLGSNQKIIAGDVNLILNEGNDTINRSNIFPETKERARSRKDNFITFTVSGINTTKDNDIYYEIMLNEGDSNTGMTRFNPEDLVFDLVELNADGSEGTYVVDAESYSDFNARRIWVNTVDRNNTTEVSKTYKLRMWLSEDVIISDTEKYNPDYPATGYENYYASVKVSVYGDFVHKEIATDASCFRYNVIDDPDVITYEYPIITLDTSDENISNCKANLMEDPSGDISVDQDGYQKFCEGTGKINLNGVGALNLEEFVVFTLQQAGAPDNLEEIIISTLGGVVTDISTEIRYYELNTSGEGVNSCKEFMLNFFNGEDLSEDSDGFQNFCKGYGTKDGLTIYEALNEGVLSTYSLVENNVLIQSEQPSSIIEITKYNKTCGTDVVIPTYIEGLPVTRISDGTDSLSAFGTKNITSVVFPKTLKYIGQYAFYNNKITSLVIGPEMQNIGYYAFMDNPFGSVDIKSAAGLGAASFNMINVYSDYFLTFQYGGTCEELNKYNFVFYGSRGPQTIITSDSNSCEYKNYNEF